VVDIAVRLITVSFPILVSPSGQWNQRVIFTRCHGDHFLMLEIVSRQQYYVIAFFYIFSRSLTILLLLTHISKTISVDLASLKHVSQRPDSRSQYCAFDEDRTSAPEEHVSEGGLFQSRDQLLQHHAARDSRYGVLPPISPRPPHPAQSLPSRANAGIAGSVD
jgi:hypothetical protein